MTALSSASNDSNHDGCSTGVGRVRGYRTTRTTGQDRLGKTRRLPARIAVTSRKPGVLYPAGSLLLDTGELLEVQGGRMKVGRDVTEVTCLGTPGVVPTAEWHAGSGSGERAVEGGVLFAGGVHKLTWPVPTRGRFHYLLFH